MGLITCTPYFIQLGNGYFIRTVGGAFLDFVYGSTMDSSGNIIEVGYTENVRLFNRDAIISKSDSNGNVLWQRTLGGSSSDYLRAAVTDSSDNIYAVGYTASIGQGGNDGLLVKYNSSGTLQWQKLLGGTGTEIVTGIALDSSNNIYISGYTSSQGQGSNDGLLVKYNSSGAVIWQKLLGKTGSDRFFKVVIDSSDNIYVSGYVDSQGAGSNDICLIKYDTSGAVVWQRIIGGSAHDYGYGIVVDSLGNIYVNSSEGSEGAGSNDIILVKYNSSGTYQWQRIIGGSGYELSYTLAVDSSDNIYMTGSTGSEGAGGDNILIVKYNSAGGIQWQRILGGTGAGGYGILLDANDDMYISAIMAGDMGLIKLPSDGSLTGTYGDFVYAVSTLTAGTSNLSPILGTLTAGTGSLTEATSTLVLTDVVINPSTIVATGFKLSNITIAALGSGKIVVDSSGNKYLIANTNKEGSGGNDLMLIKINASGVVWGRVVGAAGVDYGHGLVIDGNNDILIVGYTDYQSAGNNDAVVLKYNSAGTLLWQRMIGGAGTDRFHSVAVDSSNNIYASGYTGNDMLIVKYNSSGTIQWQKTLSGTGLEYSYSITVDSSDNIYCAGLTNSPTVVGSYDCLLVKFTTAGAVVWQRTIGGTNSDRFYDVVTDSTGNIYAVGYANEDVGNGRDMFIVKYNSLGTVQWQRAIGTSGSDIADGIQIDSSGNLYVIGAGYLIKYNSSGGLIFQKSATSIYGILVSGTEIMFLTASRLLYTTDLDAAELFDSTLSATTSGFTPLTSSLILATGALTPATSNLTSITSTLVSSSQIDIKIGLTESKIVVE